MMFNILEVHLSPNQMKALVKSFMRAMTKKLLNQQILINRNGKPMKMKDFEMIYFQVLLHMMERDEFLYAWITSDSFEADLELLFEIHVPS